MAAVTNPALPVDLKEHANGAQHQLPPPEAPGATASDTKVDKLPSMFGNDNIQPDPHGEFAVHDAEGNLQADTQTYEYDPFAAEDDSPIEDDSPAKPLNYDNALEGKAVISLEVFQIWAPVLRYIRFWWDRAPSASELADIKAVNDSIRAKFPDKKGQYDFNAESIVKIMVVFNEKVKELGLGALQDDKSKLKEKALLLSGAHNFMLQLAPLRLTCGIVLNNKAKETLRKVIHDVGHNSPNGSLERQQAGQLTGSLFFPNIWQKHVMTAGKGATMEKILTDFLKGQVNAEQAKKEFMDFNAKMREINLALGLKATDHSLPVQNLMKILTGQYARKEDRVQALVPMKGGLELLGIGEFIPVPSGSLKQSVVETIEIKAADNFDGNASRKDPETGTSVAATQRLQAQADQVQQTSQGHAPNGGNTSATGVNSDLKMEEPPVTAKDDEYDASVIRLPSTDTKNTKFGLVVTIRPSGRNQSRIIVDAGTGNKSFLKLVDEVEFGKGWGNEMVEKFPELGHTVLPRDFVKRVKASEMEEAICILEVPKAKNTLSKRAPITYIGAKWKPTADPKLKEAGLNILRIDTMSDYAAIMGKKVAEKHKEELKQKALRNERFFEKCRNKGLHPDTMAPLTEADRAYYPWLFKDAATSLFVQEDEVV